jgi:S-(hydroxymethyl)glutathione dehydrogenase / alcohol dehydrogenase
LSDAIDSPGAMRAAILVQLRAPLVVDEVALPERLEFGQTLVRVAYASICGSQLGEIDGVKGPDRYLPHLLGHEGSGVVERVGPGVTRVRQGDHVVLHWMKGAGIESETPRYEWNGRLLNAGWITAFNDFAIVSENRLTAIPSEVPLDVAPLLGCAVTTGLGVVSNNARLRIGESAIVFGVGGVGLNVVQGAALASAHPIVAIDLVGTRLELAREFGATHTINAAEADVAEEVRRAVGERGADAVIETTGNPMLIEQAYELTAPRGRTVLVGVPRHDERVSIHTLRLHFGQVLTGSHGGETDPTEDIPRYVRLFQAGKLRLRELLTDNYSLADVNKAIGRMRTGESVGRCLLTVNP